jgi:hypothetical protein
MACTARLQAEQRTRLDVEGFGSELQRTLGVEGGGQGHVGRLT